MNFDENLDLYFKIRSYQVILNYLVAMSDLTNESDMVLIKHFCLACNVYDTHISAIHRFVQAFSITQFMKLIHLLFCQSYCKIMKKRRYDEAWKKNNRKSRMFMNKQPIFFLTVKSFSVCYEEFCFNFFLK